jgi:TGS domain
MPDGSERKGKSWETSPMDVAKEVSKSLSERIVIAKVSFPVPETAQQYNQHIGR